MIPPFGENPSFDENELYSGLFPKLITGEWRKTAEATTDYNCHAWGLCHTDWGWMTPRKTSSNYTIQDFDKFFEQQGFTIHKDSTPNCKPEYQKRKIVLYCVDGVPKHSAKEIADDDWWESKLGAGIRIIHKLNHLVGSQYGRICRCYSHDNENANLYLKGKT